MADKVALIEVPTKFENSGALGVVETPTQVPFAIARAFWVTGLETGVTRGGHAHKACQQFLLCLQGHLTVGADQGEGRAVHTLDNAQTGLYAPAMTWLDYRAETVGTILLVLASDPYDADDYIHEPDLFGRLLRNGGG